MLMRPDEYRVMFEIEDRYWWYRGVRALMRELLPRYIHSRDARILDAGCGTGANLELLQKYGRATGVDISEHALEFCRARTGSRDRAFAASITDLPFAQNSFDLAVSFDVICNIADDARAFAEIARVLKPGAPFIALLPAHQWLWGEHDVAVGHQRRYSARETRAKLAFAGFRVERVLHTNALLLPFIAALRLTVRRAPGNGAAVHSDLMTLPHALNAALSALFSAEMRVAANWNFPFGLSVIAIAKKL
jgi:SAM-dependent methyltransferase